MSDPIDPVFHHDGGPMFDDGTHTEPEGWYFWEGTWADYCGPYTTEEEANIKLRLYAENL